MENLLYYIRDSIVGPTYFIYSFVCLLLMFSIIGYMFKNKYGKAEVKLTLGAKKENKKDNENKLMNNTVNKTVNNQVNQNINNIPNNQINSNNVGVQQAVPTMVNYQQNTQSITNQQPINYNQTVQTTNLSSNQAGMVSNSNERK